MLVVLFLLLAVVVVVGAIDAVQHAALMSVLDTLRESQTASPCAPVF